MTERPGRHCGDPSGHGPHLWFTHASQNPYWSCPGVLPAGHVGRRTEQPAPEPLARRAPGRPAPRVAYVSGERWADQIRRVLEPHVDGRDLLEMAVADLTDWATLAGDARYHQGQVMATPLVQRYRNALEEIAGAGPRPDGGILRDRAVSALDGTQPAPQSPGRGETPP